MTEWLNGVYSANVKLGKHEYQLTTKLGEIKRRGLNKYQWFVQPTKYRTDWPVAQHMQGTAPSEEAAKAKVEACWNLPTMDNRGVEHAAS